MKLFDSFRSALQSIIVNKLRSALTMLGVIIGVASVIAMVAVGNGASIQVQQQVLSLGSNLVTVTPGNQSSDTGLRGAGAQSTNLTLDDMNAIQAQLGPTIGAVEAEQSAGRWQVTAAGQNWNTNVVGVTTGYPEVRDWALATGSFFTDDDVTVYAQVAVIGSVTAANLFGDGVDPTGQTIQLRQAFGGGGGPGGAVSRARIVNFKVVGMLDTKGTTFGFSRDDQILVPTTTAQRVLTGKTNSVSSIIVKAASSDQMANTTADVTDVLLQRHKITDPTAADFTVTNQNDTLAALNQVTGTFTILLAAIGGISLLVGGIGIMNIMLVSVNERTREIGIRKAVGARRRDILVQFLIEAIGLTGIGGILGILLGWGITVVVHQIPAAANIPIAITAGTVAIAVGVSVAIGVVFGLYPAMRAARLHPIQALRYE
ncbi:MAG TPA: ABC transporter permease [Candidatus Limnocylindria bacterium]